MARLWIVFSSVLFVSIIIGGCNSDHQSSEGPERLHDIQVSNLDSPCDVISKSAEILRIMLSVMEKYDMDEHNPLISPMDKYYTELGERRLRQLMNKGSEKFEEDFDLEDIESCREFEAFKNQLDKLDEMGIIRSNL